MVVEDVLIILLLFFEFGEEFLDLFLEVHFLFFEGIEELLDSVDLSKVLC